VNPNPFFTFHQYFQEQRKMVENKEREYVYGIKIFSTPDK
jgi:hypothetical protein